MSWEADLAAAAAHQNLVAQLLMARLGPGYDFVESQGYDKDKDLTVFRPNGLPLAVECKNDIRCYDSANLAVEVACNGRPSGLVTTLADAVVYTSHCYSPKLPLQEVTPQFGVRCAAVTWVAPARTLIDAAQAAVAAGGGRVVETYRDPQNVATCLVVYDAVGFLKTLTARPRVGILDTRRCPWPHLHELPRKR